MKKIIALAVLGAFAAPAFADSGNVTIKGDIRVGLNFINSAASVADGSGDASQKRVDGRGNIYFGGSEDLGNGNSAIFQIGSRFRIGTQTETGSAIPTTPGDFDSKGGTFGNRNTWVGLKGNWGTVRLGRGEDVFGDGKYDNMVVYGDSPSFNHAAVSGDGNMVRYDLPAMGNFTASAQWRAGEDKTSTSKANDAFIARADYDTDNWDVGGAFESGRNGGDRFNNYILAGSVKFAGFQFGVEHLRFKDKDTSDKMKSTGFYLNYGIDKVSLEAQYFTQKATDGATGADTKSKTSALGAQYALSKRTVSYAEYLRVKDEGSPAQRRFLVGVKHSF